MSPSDSEFFQGETVYAPNGFVVEFWVSNLPEQEQKALLLQATQAHPVLRHKDPPSITQDLYRTLHRQGYAFLDPFFKTAIANAYVERNQLQLFA